MSAGLDGRRQPPFAREDASGFATIFVIANLTSSLMRCGEQAYPSETVTLPRPRRVLIDGLLKMVLAVMPLDSMPDCLYEAGRRSVCDKIPSERLKRVRVHRQ